MNFEYFLPPSCETKKNVLCGPLNLQVYLHICSLVVRISLQSSQQQHRLQKPDITQLFNILFYEPLNTFSLFLSQREANPSKTNNEQNRTTHPHTDIKLVLCLTRTEYKMYLYDV